MSDEHELPFTLESDLERSIAGDPAWRAGLTYGKPRRGHPEGSVANHVADVLANIDRLYGDSQLRDKLRLIALIHDSFKVQVDRLRPRTGENHHATIARRFAERYISDPAVLDVIELHDEAYNAWQNGHNSFSFVEPKNNDATRREREPRADPQPLC